MTIYATPAGLRHQDVILIDDDLYEIRRRGAVLGFVHKAGNVYVALAGSTQARACEVGQSLSWDDAILMIQGAAHEQARPRVLLHSAA